MLARRLETVFSDRSMSRAISASDFPARKQMGHSSFR
jgi:hypothetical protein